MISKKELEYVNTWARNVPYPGTSYSEEAMEDLKQAFSMYEEYYKDRQYNIMFSDGNEIDLEIEKKNLCHMIGIDTKDLLSEYRADFRKNALDIDPERSVSSYYLLQQIINNSDKVLDYNMHKQVFNSYRVRLKSHIFDKMSDFSRFDFGCINFDKSHYEEQNGGTISGDSSRYLYIQSNEGNCPYFMMGIRPDSISGKQIVETLIAPVEPENYFRDQEVVIPTQLLKFTLEDLTKLNATPSEKIALLNTYKAIVSRYNIPFRANIYGDYETMLVDQTSKEKVYTK